VKISEAFARSCTLNGLRGKLLQLFSKKDEVYTVSELCRTLNVRSGTVKYHLYELLREGVIKKVRGPRSRLDYWGGPEAVETLTKQLYGRVDENTKHSKQV
jgi:DNA-binding MarR family transcriptional regulator